MKRNILLLTLFFLLLTPIFAQSDVFSINITINYIEISLEYISGGNYIAWWISDLVPGDTAITDFDELVKVINRSNISVDILCSAWDAPDSTTIDSLWPIWTISEDAGIDTFALLWASYNTPPVSPNFADAQSVFETPIRIENNITSGEERYFNGWFIAPIEGYAGERHRLQTRFTAVPSVIPGY
ncbi:hypothetical protein KAH81_08445 [bacterium]|nr:hypothetical protein [bacterium]